jgi:hypothetical protein
MTQARMILNIKGTIEGFQAVEADNNVVRLKTITVPPEGGVSWGPLPIDRVILETVEQLDNGAVRYTVWGLPR